MREPTFEWVDIDLLVPNSWNPNAMDEDMLAKAIESIHRFGFVDPVTCREINLNQFEIIDGEHRWAMAKEHSGSCVKVKDAYTEHIGLHQISITNLGIIEDSIAKQLTIVLNETRGQYQPKEMGSLLVNLLAAEPLPELLGVLPFTPQRFQELAELPTVNWDDLSLPKGNAGSGSGERNVERVFRLPASAAAKLDQALREARDDDATPDWRALQTIAEHFLGS